MVEKQTVEPVLFAYIRWHIVASYIEEQDMRLRLGDHVVTPRTGYAHHGIYIGRKKVVHYSGFARGMSKGPIGITSMDDFIGGESVMVVRYFTRQYSFQETVERAKSRVGEDMYNLMRNNCEHFASWCVNGKARSHQVERVEQIATNVCGAYGAWTALAHMKSVISVPAGASITSCVLSSLSPPVAATGAACAMQAISGSGSLVAGRMALGKAVGMAVSPQAVLFTTAVPALISLGLMVWNKCRE